MSNSVVSYLAELRRALAGVDPATLQDALADAEEYLVEALDRARSAEPGKPDSELMAAITREYGSPEEIAAAYRQIERHVGPPLARRPDPRPKPTRVTFFGVLADPRAWGAFIYGLIALVTGTIYFSWAMTGISVSLGLAVLVIGFPLFVMFILSVRGLSLVEGRIVEGLLGVRMPRRPVFYDRRFGLWGGCKKILKEGRTWSTLAYMILMLPLGTLYFSLLISLVAISISLVAQPIIAHVLDLPFAHIEGARIYLSDSMAPLVMILGGALFIGTLHVARVIGLWHGWLARAMLVRE